MIVFATLARAGEKLVSVFPGAEEGNEAKKLGRVARADVGGLTDEVLGLGNITHLASYLF